MAFNIGEEVKKLPGCPGVYIMHDKTDAIIYVGKAVNLKNRVSSYFRAGTPHTQKINRMIANVDHFEYIVVDSETEALVLECNLIKEHKPRYNTMLKDDKSYPYIKVTVNEDFPRVFFARKSNIKDKSSKADKARYFGPYTCSEAVHDTIELLKKLYPFRTCRMSISADGSNVTTTRGGSAVRACLYYHLGQCGAPCINAISKEDYAKNINKILYFLDGHADEVEKELEEKMYHASEELAFEKAAMYRDKLKDVKRLMQSQKINNEDSTDRDVIAAAVKNDDAVMQVFYIRHGKILGRDHFYIKGVTDETKSDIYVNFINQYYSGTPYVPKEILVADEIEEKERTSAENMLSKIRGNKVTIRMPKRGDKEGLTEIARKNAEMVINKDADRIKLENARTEGAVKELCDLLDIPVIKRIESFDISNTSGFESVGSMVVYENGKPKKNDYRKFKIKSVEGPNDYASMNEVLTRRFMHEEGDSFNSSYPDLILMDGGRGQVNIAEEVLQKLNIKDVRVAGMVKDDRHRTRGIYFNNVELPIDTHSECFKLVTRIQDETHRFAITYHKLLRSKASLRSVLDDIPGIGEARKLALIKTMQSIEKIKNASVEELMQVPRMNKKAAESVYLFFRKKEDKKE